MIGSLLLVGAVIVGVPARTVLAVWCYTLRGKRKSGE
jgi:hypothetical protein